MFNYRIQELQVRINTAFENLVDLIPDNSFDVMEHISILEEALIKVIEDDLNEKYEIYDYKLPVTFVCYLEYSSGLDPLEETEYYDLVEKFEKFIANLPQGESHWEFDVDDQYFSRSNDIYDLGDTVCDATLYVKKGKQ